MSNRSLIQYLVTHQYMKTLNIKILIGVRMLLKNSFFEDCEINNFLVLNIDIKNFISTFIHYLENKYGSYRYEKSFKGKL